MNRPCCLRLALLLLLCAGGPSVHAADRPQPVDEAATLDDVRYVIGLTAANAPIYWGQNERSTGLRPFVALRWGKLRISNSGAGGLIGETNAGGASTDLLDRDGWRLRTGLRIDRGRRIQDDSEQRLSDLPRVRGTLRGRLVLTRTLPGNAAWSLTVAPDLLGREGGTTLQLGYFRQLATPEWLSGLGGQWSVGADLNMGSKQYMQSYFGVPQGAQRFVPYEPGAGLRNASLGLGWQRQLDHDKHWVLFGGAAAQRLLGPAADAPFVQRTGTWTVNLGLAYRH
ncbi:MipA/OmpV family protein [Inhella crocodyli]|uniref:MipA/OmpV family protein n=1 Tax=Inhella crocodyli TaxID=2499851 RepID=A0A3S2UH78_9BURK|nr:MipA/OmpV family protein [Inhella crocodyli]